MSYMRLLAQARLLLGHHPFTLADARALEALEEEAVGEEGSASPSCGSAPCCRPTRRPGTICRGGIDL